MKKLKTFEQHNNKLDYHDAIKQIEKKYNFKSRNYTGIPSQRKEDHFETYQKVMNDPMPFNGRYPDSPNNTYRIPDGNKMVKCSKKEYDDAFKLIHDHYKRYQEWEKLNPDIPYMDFWHYLTDINDDVRNGGYIYIPRIARVKENSAESNIEMFNQILKMYPKSKEIRKNVEELIKREEETPRVNPWKGWEQKITDLIFSEYDEYTDKDGIEMYIEW